MSIYYRYNYMDDRCTEIRQTDRHAKSGIRHGIPDLIFSQFG